MRSHRVVLDEDVDRRQVYVWRHTQPSRTNSPSSLPSVQEILCGAFTVAAFKLNVFSSSLIGLVDCIYCPYVFLFPNVIVVIRHTQVALAPVFHLFPSRTEKLSPGAPMVLHRNAGE